MPVMVGVFKRQADTESIAWPTPNHGIGGRGARSVRFQDSARGVEMVGVKVVKIKSARCIGLDDSDGKVAQIEGFLNDFVIFVVFADQVAFDSNAGAI